LLGEMNTIPVLSEKLYDPAFLAQESDDLLRYL